jgi:hypothetical protein
MAVGFIFDGGTSGKGGELLAASLTGRWLVRKMMPIRKVSIRW